MGQQRVRWLNGIANSKEMSLSKLWEIVTEVCGLLQSEGSQRVRPDLVTKQQSHLSPTVCSHSLSHASTKAQTQCGTNFMGVIQTAHTISTAKGSGEAWIQAALYTAILLSSFPSPICLYYLSLWGAQTSCSQMELDVSLSKNPAYFLGSFYHVLILLAVLLLR